MSRRFPRSCNQRSAIVWPAAALWSGLGSFSFPNNHGAVRRAGMALDLAAVQRLRLAGELSYARDRLALARDARLFLIGSPLP